MQNQTQARSKSNRIILIIGALLLSCCCIFSVTGVILYPTVRTAVAKAFSAPAPVPLVELSPTTNGATSSGGPASGGLGDSLLKSEVWNSIVNWFASNQNCSDMKSTRIDVSKSPDSNGAWEEAWTVQACGQTSVLVIDFTPSPGGGTDYTISQ